MEQLTREERVAELRHAESLSIGDLEGMLCDGDVETLDGCYVEPDGQCPHGYRSPLLILGYI